MDKFKTQDTHENPDSMKSLNVFSYILFFVLVLGVCVTPSRLSRDDIYSALRTIDLSSGLEQDPNHFINVQSTPTKQTSSSSISFATPTPKKCSHTASCTEITYGM